ncbi:MAG TPA: glycosyltransferase family 39 protein [Candidatus Udaeobacter sp.]|jgi:4-amino-4-deoxy-L-arabinose transferase-like glycosyltransferase|nr:glycosyltransferase family 39 protein [Candidatus Udaeobacter sp.]
MTASDSNGSLRNGIRRLLKNQWFIAVAIFVAAVVVRCGFHLYNPDASGFFIYHGSPISDGCSYTYKAITIAQGYGIPRDQQPAIRPFYAIVLACLYTWTGFSLRAVTALNILIGGATAVLIYLCGKLAFNRFCGLAAGLFFALDPTQLLQTPQACTEPLGLLFFVASVYAVLRALENHRPLIFFFAGLFVGLSNLTRPLTLFTLPFYIGVTFLVAWREGIWRAAWIRAFLILFGFLVVVFPWLIRQERSYGILTISDNIGEAIYSATSPAYRQWTPIVRKDADAEGIPNTIGDRYRYFMRRAAENVKEHPGFYLGTVGHAVWEYANTFGPRSRNAPRYANWYSRASEAQSVLGIYLVSLIVVAWLLQGERRLSAPSFTFLITSLGLFLFYRVLPVWLTFVPVLVGIVFSWRSKHEISALVMLGTLVLSVLGSAIFANPVLFRAVLMTDWLFLLYLVAAIWFPAEILARRVAGNPEPVWAFRTGNVVEDSPFQDTLSSLCRRALVFSLVALLGFFALSGVRLIALTMSDRVARRKTQWGPAWMFWRTGIKNLTMPDRIAILHHFEDSSFGVLPQGTKQYPIYIGGKDPPKPGDYVVDIHGYYYDYYIPAGEIPRPPAIGPKPYARTLIILSPFDFIIPGVVPADFARRPLVFVGVVVPPEIKNRETAGRPQTRGLAIIPLNANGRPDFARAVTAPPTECLSAAAAP